ncbi:MAG: alpha/beta hydrolase [Betaproteobacteria bacterium]
MTNIPGTIGPLKKPEGFELAFRQREPLPASPKRCVVLLHGVGGDETNLSDLAADFDADTLVVFPRGPLQLGVGQFAWFRVAFTAAGPQIVAAEAEHSRRLLIAFIGRLQKIHGIAPRHTVVAGFSQGGILSASAALTAPECVANFGVLSGRILPELEPLLASREDLAGVKGFIGHGEFDSKLPVAWAHRADEWLDELGVEHALRLYPIDHGINAQMHADFMAWIEALG